MIYEDQNPVSLHFRKWQKKSSFLYTQKQPSVVFCQKKGKKFT